MAAAREALKKYGVPFREIEFRGNNIGISDELKNVPALTGSSPVVRIIREIQTEKFGNNRVALYIEGLNSDMMPTIVPILT